MVNPLTTFRNKINSAYKSILISDDPKSSLKIARFSSGVFSLDAALGGGWPRGRICLVIGDYSTGKTVITTQAIKSVAEYDQKTKLHKSQVNSQEFTPGKSLFIDAEGSFDPDWAEKQGVSTDSFLHSRIEHGEQAVDIVEAAINEKAFDLIVVDSIAAIVPTKEIEGSAEEAGVGLQARLINKAMRKWQTALTRAGKDAPTIICINQLREKMTLYGDNRTWPGGKGQNYAASIVVFTSSAKIEDSETVAQGMALMGGSTKKNKTFPPKKEFAYELLLADDGDKTKGTVNNTDLLMANLKKFDLLKKDGKEYVLLGSKFATQDELKEELRKNPTFFYNVWQHLLSILCP